MVGCRVIRGAVVKFIIVNRMPVLAKGVGKCGGAQAETGHCQQLPRSIRGCVFGVDRPACKGLLRSFRPQNTVGVGGIISGLQTIWNKNQTFIPVATD